MANGRFGEDTEEENDMLEWKVFPYAPINSGKSKKNFHPLITRKFKLKIESYQHLPVFSCDFFKFYISVLDDDMIEKNKESYTYFQAFLLVRVASKEFFCLFDCPRTKDPC